MQIVKNVNILTGQIGLLDCFLLLNASINQLYILIFLENSTNGISIVMNAKKPAHSIKRKKNKKFSKLSLLFHFLCYSTIYQKTDIHDQTTT